MLRSVWLGFRRQPAGVTLGLLIAAALLLRLVFLLMLGTPARLTTEEIGFEIGDIAESLYGGDGYQHEGVESSWMPPLYPYLLALFFTLFGGRNTTSASAILIFQAMISAMTLWPLYLLGQGLFGPEVGLLTAGFWALFPASIPVAVGTIWHTALTGFWLVWSIWALWRLDNGSPRWRDVLLASALLGLLALTDPWAVVTLLPAWLLWQLWRSRGNWARMGPRLAVAFLFCAAISPWIMNRYLVLDQLFFIEARFGVNFWLGNQRDAVQASASDSKWRQIEARYSEPTVAELWALTEPERSQRLARLAATDIAAQPRRFWANTGRRILLFWQAEVWRLKPLLVAMAIGAALGLAVAWRRRAPVAIVALLLLLYPLPYYLTVADKYKYRYPLDGTLLLLLAYLLVSVARTWAASLQAAPTRSLFG